ncbi:hypothetical protein MK079_05220, partial [Candidatus Gracilibacteria bacterium]|nr:hypothetical protein [Candidatus Gracilibacteria bacterium]
MMQKKYVFFLIFFSGLLLVLGSVFAAAKTPEERYEERIENICDPLQSEYSFYGTKKYEFLKDKKEALAEGEQALGIPNILEKTKNQHIENMDGIYQCALLEVKRNTLEQISQNDILKGKVKTRVEDKIQKQIHKLELSESTLGCNIPNDESINKKVEVLKQTSYELCSHHSYLEYLREYSNNLGNLLEGESAPITRIAELQAG